MQEEIKEKFTWNDLLVAITQMPVELRDQQVSMAIDDETYFRNVDSIDYVPVDIYANKDEPEDCGDLETLQYAHGPDFKLEDYKLVTKKGTPFLWEGIQDYSISNQ